MQAKHATPTPYLEQIRLERLEIRNFKGCRELTLHLDGRSASIYGDNAAGKTTLYDALTWLLFGKDSSGAGKFNIKPLSPDGEVKDHAAETSVEAVLEADGQSVTLRRTYKELWTKKRGRKEAVFDGHTSEFFYNGLPVQKQDFEGRVAQLCDEQTFRTLADVRWFCAGESEANRRSVLFDLIGGVSEADVLASNPDFAPLEEALSGLTVEEYKAAAQKQRRTLQTRSKTIPARIDEQQRTVEEYSGFDFVAIRQRLQELEAQEAEAKAELDALTGETGTALLRERKKTLLAQLDALEQRNTAHRHQQREPGQVHQYNSELRSLLNELQRLDADQIREDAEAKVELDAIDKLREQWRSISAREKETQAETFDDSDDTCHTCGQKLPPDKLDERRDHWEQERTAYLGKLSAEKQDCAEWAQKHSDRVKELKQRRDERKQRREELDARQAEITEAVKGLEAQVVQDLPGYEKECFELEEEIRSIGEQIKTAEADSGAVRTEARKKLAAVSGQVRQQASLLACESVLSAAKAREQELKEQLRDVGAETESLDALLELCDEFARAKAEYIDEQVSGRFGLVRWKLFDEQINGGLRDCCIATVNGVPYSDLNSGMKINAGLDVIRTLSAAKGITVPLFIDNAESVTALEEVGTQVIRLVVSEADKELRVEVEA